MLGDSGLRRARIGRVLNPLRWLGGRHRADEERSALAFAVRLLATVAATFTVVGIAGYVLLEQNLAHRQIDEYAAALRADVKAFEHEGWRGTSPADALLRVDPLLDATEHRAGTREAVLIDPHHVVVQSLNDVQLGAVEADAGINGALEHHRSFAGHDHGAGSDPHDFQFVVPVELPAGRYAYEVTYDHRVYDAQVSEVRMILLLIGLFALFAGGAVFYLVGGRRLMRDHRTVLRRATRDGLTDLPNQRAFQDDLQQAVGSAARYEDPFALALLDVDNFKLVNDRHGHPYGDTILKRVAAVLRTARPGDRPYRIGGDEFALMLAHTDAEGARVLARRLSQQLETAGVETSIGVSALHPGVQADELRGEADAALYEAKRQGGSRVAHFDDIRERVFVTTSEKKEAVQRLIAEGRLRTVFQPIWDLAAESLLGVEALTRPDPAYGLSGPAEAFDIAEQIGRVHQLDVLCVEHALESLPELEPGVKLFLNVSPLTLDLDADSDDWLCAAVERAGLAPESVVVEVTERFGGRTASVVERLKQLRQQGFKIAVDDVGTGNSGLEMLREIHAEYVKIDRSIVITAATEPGARAVLMAMAIFARQTGAFVIAEGIEDDETLEFLRGIDDRDLSSSAIIQGGQGFGLGRPSQHVSPQAPPLLRGSHGREPSETINGSVGRPHSVGHSR